MVRAHESATDAHVETDPRRDEKTSPPPEHVNQPLDKVREDNGSHAAARYSQTQGDAATLFKVHAHNGDGRDVGQSEP